ncbi:uncharacterized protein LOC126470799 [Schistocerca serialis cubense]|uniref:uncharacterized protein LOC126470799 n=1 Tax=Schistocerca serialis cubense TaxID=2023355 RepID=UPI00214EC2A1|nr:uncharacterized protein LOC126470799 [Schistocerca serialis cubense]
MKLSRTASDSSSSSKRAHVDEVPFPDFFQQILVDLDNQIEMERAQAQLEYAPNSEFGSTTQNVQGGDGSVQTAPATQDTQSLEEEETNLPDPFEEEINLPEWFEDLLDFGNELLKPWSQSGEGISHGVGRVPRAVVAGAGLGRTEPQRHAAPCVAPIRASREADAEHAPAPPPALSQPFGCAARPPSPQPGPSNRLSPPPPLEAAAHRRRPRKRPRGRQLVQPPTKRQRLRVSVDFDGDREIGIRA